MIEIDYRHEWFNSGYYVYLLIVTHRPSEQQLYYIGQTGDRKHTSARSPFYRMMGHFNTYGYQNSTTDSQLVAGLVDKGLIEQPTEEKHARVCMEEAIANGDIRIVARFLKVHDFDGADHPAKRRFTEAVEQSVIDQFVKSFGEDRVFNKKLRGATKNMTKESKTKAKEVYQELIGAK